MSYFSSEMARKRESEGDRQRERERERDGERGGRDVEFLEEWQCM